MADPVTSTLPTEVQLALEVMPCQAMRRSYDSAEQPHPCSYFSEWGYYHSFDYADAGPPPREGIEQPSSYRGKRHLVPELLSGCRKAPIMCVGINPNLPGWSEASRNAVHPYFDDYLQYAHYFRYRSTAKLRIPRNDYRRLLGGRTDTPNDPRPLVTEGDTVALELDPVTMYRAYQSLLEGLAEAEGWQNHKLAVGEDLSYANMVACGSARWVVNPNPDDPSMPAMGAERARGIVDACFVKRRYFLRQLTQSLPNVLLVFSATTADPFIRVMQNRFRPEGAPRPGERLDQLLQREIRLEYGTLPDGTPLDARVIFLPHASARPQDFERARAAAIRHMRDEVAAGRLVYRTATGHLGRLRGGCFFCTNELYRIGPCDYKDELTALAAGAVQPLAADGASSPDPLAERQEQLRLLERFAGPTVEARARAERTDATAAPVIVPLDAAAPSSPAMVLFGKVVTMTGTVLNDGALYLRQGRIVAVRRRMDGAPSGFEAAPRIETQGVIYPGLLDLHNHLAYNILPLWIPPRKFDNRSGWLRNPDYSRRVGRPMTILTQRRRDLIKAIVRYIEAKLLIGGVTSGQGMISRFGGNANYQGLVRNFEVSADTELPSAHHRIPDLEEDQEQIDGFRDDLASGRPFFFHLAEGTDDEARAQFRLLEREELLAGNLIAIHCAGLERADFQVLKQKQVRAVWSPLSNMLLYGRSLKLAEMLDTGVPFSFGSDWTPSGSRNLLLELKVARLAAAAAGVSLSDQKIAEAATVVAARSAGWGDKLGSIAENKYADLLVLDDSQQDPYENLVCATERNIRLVVIAGHVRHGDESLVRSAGLADDRTEALQVGGRAKRLNLNHPSSPINHISLSMAAEVLRDEMSDLQRAESRGLFRPLSSEPEDSIELDLQPIEGPDAIEPLAALPPITSVPLDGLTVIDDAAYLEQFDTIPHLPEFLKGATGLKSFY